MSSPGEFGAESHNPRSFTDSLRLFITEYSIPQLVYQPEGDAGLPREKMQQVVTDVMNTGMLRYCETTGTESYQAILWLNSFTKGYNLQYSGQTANLLQDIERIVAEEPSDEIEAFLLGLETKRIIENHEPDSVFSEHILKRFPSLTEKLDDPNSEISAALSVLNTRLQPDVIRNVEKNPQAGESDQASDKYFSQLVEVLEQKLKEKDKGDALEIAFKTGIINLMHSHPDRAYVVLQLGCVYGKNAWNYYPLIREYFDIAESYLAIQRAVASQDWNLALLSCGPLLYAPAPIRKKIADELISADEKALKGESSINKKVRSLFAGLQDKVHLPRTKGGKKEDVPVSMQDKRTLLRELIGRATQEMISIESESEIDNFINKQLLFENALTTFQGECIAASMDGSYGDLVDVGMENAKVFLASGRPRLAEGILQILRTYMGASNKHFTINQYSGYAQAYELLQQVLPRRDFNTLNKYCLALMDAPEEIRVGVIKNMEMFQQIVNFCDDPQWEDELTAAQEKMRLGIK